jgi:hypothetical protein
MRRSNRGSPGGRGRPAPDSGLALLEGQRHVLQAIGDQVGSTAGHVRAAQPHGHADVGGFEGGTVVDPVAGDRHHLSLALQRLHDRQLLHRLDPCEDALFRHVALEGLGILGHQPHLAFAGHLVVAVGDAKLPGDGQGRGRVVAGDHAHGDSGLPAAVDRRFRLGPDRVHLPHQAEELEILKSRRRLRGDLGLLEAALGHRQHPISGIAQALDLGRHGRAVDIAAHGHESFGRPLDMGHHGAAGRPPSETKVAA